MILQESFCAEKCYGGMIEANSYGATLFANKKGSMINETASAFYHLSIYFQTA